MEHKISLESIYPTDDKVKAIIEVPETTNSTELKTCMRVLNCCKKLLKNVARVASRKSKRWVWAKQCGAAFGVTKQLLSNSRVPI